MKTEQTFRLWSEGHLVPGGKSVLSLGLTFLVGVVELYLAVSSLLAGVSNLSASLGHTGRRSVVLGHTLNTQTLMKTKTSHNVLSELVILCWAAFMAILGCMRPVDS